MEDTSGESPDDDDKNGFTMLEASSSNDFPYDDQISNPSCYYYYYGPPLNSPENLELLSKLRIDDSQLMSTKCFLDTNCPSVTDQQTVLAPAEVNEKKHPGQTFDKQGIPVNSQQSFEEDTNFARLIKNHLKIASTKFGDSFFNKNNNNNNKNRASVEFDHLEDEQLPKSGMEDEQQSMKERLKCAWNNVKFGSWQLRVPTTFNHQEYPIWLLAKMYHPQPAKQNQSASVMIPSGSEFGDFLLDYQSRIFLSYRMGFPAFQGTNITTDCGWSCILRSTQMMIAQALLVSNMGRDWRLSEANVDSEQLLREIIRLFEDCAEADLSLHRMMQIATSENKQEHSSRDSVGIWYAPSRAADLMRKAISMSSNDLVNKFALLVTRDCCLVKSDVISASHDWSKAVILIVCLRLGADSVNHCYFGSLKRLMSMSTCIGIAGGRPKHSVYFVGQYYKHLIYMDPHLVQKYEPLRSNDKFSLKTFHCAYPMKMPMRDMDPSCSIGFLVRSQKEFDHLISELYQFQLIELEDHCAEKRPVNNCDVLFSVLNRRAEGFWGSPESKDGDKVAAARERGFELL